jgi:hypothetical protein
MHITYKFLCAATLPEASVEDLTGQISVLKGKLHLLVCLLSEIIGSFSFFTELLLFRTTAEKEKLALEHDTSLQV